MKKNPEILEFRKGEIIFQQREIADCMYDIHCGKVGIYADYGLPSQKLLAELGRDQFFGEMGLIEGRPRSATAVALERGTKIQIITEETFQGYFAQRPAKAFVIMQNMSKRLRGLTRDYVEACRTVSEAVETEQTGTAQSSDLKDRLKRFSEDFVAGFDAGPSITR